MATDNLAPACVGRFVGVDSACGCTLTATTITGLSPAQIVALGNQEIELTRAILDTAEAKMLGVPENPLMNLLNSRVKDVKKELNTIKISEQSIVMPFIQRVQRSFINANYFIITAGTACPFNGQTIGGLYYPQSCWVLTLGLGQSPFQSALTNIQRYFVPGQTLVIQTWDNVNTQNARNIVLTILTAVEADVGATPYAQVTAYAPVSDTNWTTVYTPTMKGVYQPTFGVCELGSNSIDDRESYCNNMPSDLGVGLVINWLQTIRESYCREQSYEEVLDAILKGNVNDYLKTFQFQSIAEQQKMMKVAYDRAWFNTIFYGQAIDVDNQTANNWQSLPIVYDLVNTSCPLGYKASTLGIFTLLNQCNRCVDMQGMPLNLSTIFTNLYYLKRWREATGDRVTVIDGFTDRFTKNHVFDAMTKYYLARYQIATERFAKIDQKVTFDNIVMFDYDVYDIPEAGVKWAVFQLDYFNDLKDASAAIVVGWNFSQRQNNLWMIDWSDITIGMAGSHQVTRKNPDPATADIYKCVIEPNIRTYDLRSKMVTVMVDRPNRHLIYYNYANGCPRVSLTECQVPQS